MTPPWPKGPFPERYRWPAVESRLRGAWASDERAAALVALAERGCVAAVGDDDEFVRALELPPGVDASALRAELTAAGVFAFELERVDVEEVALGLVASADPLDALVAVGVASPEHGIGNAAIVRFAKALGAFARWEIRRLGESRALLGVTARDRDDALRIADRARHICPPLASRDAASLADELDATRALDLDYRRAR